MPDAGERIVALAEGALLESTPADTVGELLTVDPREDGVLDVVFDSAMAGYPGWRWTVSVAALEGEEPSVLELGLVPGDDALLAPAWVPWADRLADYRAAQEAESAESQDDSDEDASDDDADLDDPDLDDVDDDLDGDELDDDDDDEIDGVDIDAVDDQPGIDDAGEAEGLSAPAEAPLASDPPLDPAAASDEDPVAPEGDPATEAPAKGDRRTPRRGRGRRVFRAAGRS